jgi:hypothetical protein
MEMYEIILTGSSRENAIDPVCKSRSMSSAPSEIFSFTTRSTGFARFHVLSIVPNGLPRTRNVKSHASW